MTYLKLFQDTVVYKDIEFTVTYRPDFCMGGWAWDIEWDPKHDEDPITDEFCGKCDLWEETGLDWILKP
jgi:hypothetical protein